MWKPLRLLWGAVTGALDVGEVWVVAVGLMTTTATLWAMATMGVPDIVFYPAGLGAFLLTAHGLDHAMPAIIRMARRELDITVDSQDAAVFRVMPGQSGGAASGDSMRFLQLLVPITAISNHEDDDILVDIHPDLTYRPGFVWPKVARPIDWKLDRPIAVERKKWADVGLLKIDVPIFHVFYDPITPDQLDPDSELVLTFVDRNSSKSTEKRLRIMVQYPEPLNVPGRLSMDPLPLYVERLRNGQVSSLSREPTGSLQSPKPSDDGTEAAPRPPDA